MSDAARADLVVVCLVDGWGWREPAGAMAPALTPRTTDLLARFPSTWLDASGEAVGLPAGAAGNGEAGYKTAGTGRPASVLAPRIDAAAAASRLATLDAVAPLVEAAEFRRGKSVEFASGLERDRCTVHLFGLASDGDNHGSLRHLFEMIDAIAFYELPLAVHAFVDGRDMPPKSAWRCIEPLAEHLERKGRLATIAGRAYAMDAEGGWDKTLEVFRAIVIGDDVPVVESPYQALAEAYDDGHTDADVPPVRLGDYAGMSGDFTADFAGPPGAWAWRGEDVGIFVGRRGDRFAQLGSMLLRRGLPPEIEAKVSVLGRAVYAFDEASLVSLVPIPGVAGVAAALPEEPVPAPLTASLAAHGVAVTRFADAARVAHAAHYFDGRVAAAPAAVTTAPKSTQTLAEAERAVRSGTTGLVLVALSGLDDAAHTASATATENALGAIDEALGRLADAVLAAGGSLLVTSAHGGAEALEDAAGQPSPAHTAAPVPLILVSHAHASSVLRKGTLADVAPTVLDLFALPPPAEMAGRSLLASPP
jgi:2,3-bisphosphoglycerate-independent phosphoglycerate mutase